MATAVVTGARGGIGSAVAAAFEEAGYTLHGVDVDDAFPELDRFDALVCAHGISGRRHGDGPVDECTDEGWDTVLDANLSSVFRYARLAIPALRRNGGGAVVTVASVLGLVGGDSDFATHAYAAAKAGVIGLTRAMAVHYAPDGIRCNVVAPGPIVTAMTADMPAEWQDQITNAVPLGRFGTPEECAAVVAFLCSDAAGYVTGALVPVDGGLGMGH